MRMIVQQRRMQHIGILWRIVFAGRLLKRVRVFSQYLYFFVIGRLSPALARERPKFKPAGGLAAVERDRSDCIEFHLEADENARHEFEQRDPARDALVRGAEKYRTDRCFVCGAPLTPMVQVIDTDDPTAQIELAWCRACDHMQYSVLPTKDWVTRWYAAQYDRRFSLQENLDMRRPTQFYRHRLAPYLRARRMKILDIGAGYGEKTHAFTAMGHELHCTEATTPRAEYLRRLIGDRVYFGTLADPAVAAALRRSGPFDLIFTYHVVEHMYNAHEELQLLREIAADDAVFYLAIPELYKEGILNNIYALEHTASFSRRSAKTLMRQVGFDPIVARDDLFQNYSDYCQYLIGRRMRAQDAVDERVAEPAGDMVGFLAQSFKFARLARLDGNRFSYRYVGRRPLTYCVSAESKRKCREPALHLPLRIYHRGLPLFWMQ
jgi:2-polyprenyl-3-methyl-5-hydroxy-6-metoxy-1,4-benzoquinol methylase